MEYQNLLNQLNYTMDNSHRIARFTKNILKFTQNKYGNIIISSLSQTQLH